MAITTWSPTSDLRSLHNAMDRLFNETLLPTRARSGIERLASSGDGFLPLDVYERDNEWVVRAAIPGADSESVEVTCDGDTISIRGEITEPEDSKSERYRMQENFYGRFSRQVTFSEQLDCDQTKAEFHNGMLTLRFPRSKQKKHEPKKIPVSASQ